MTILGIGVDIIHTPRISALLKKRYAGRFVKKILSPAEYSGWVNLSTSGTSGDLVRYLAVRWSVKEAAYKALYPTVRPTWKELTYTSLNSGIKPSLSYQPLDGLSGSLVGPIHVSVSHDGEYVLSQVLVECRDD
ncbi:hypothetical protein CC2G_010608 [Coprinopsis cinerea AmutBmut pab1-1]|nr:hypothetical protein CC2G_010608 [Coprinopsis cinerea AmutBmut pab1-1]